MVIVVAWEAGGQVVQEDILATGRKHHREWAGPRKVRKSLAHWKGLKT